MIKVFGIMDVRAGVYSTPFFMRATGEAIRAFKNVADDPQTTIARNPGDFRLDCLGTFDEETGTFAADGKASLGFASEYRVSGVPLAVVPSDKVG